MKLKQMMFMKIFIEIKIYLILVITLKIQSFFYLANKKVIGKMKDEVNGKIINEFVRLKSLVIVDNQEIKKAKGINKNVAKNIRHKEYFDVLFNRNLIRHKMKRIQMKLHRIGTYDVCKISLSCFDDKRYILYDDSINSLTYFHPFLFYYYIFEYFYYSNAFLFCLFC